MPVFHEGNLTSTVPIISISSLVSPVPGSEGPRTATVNSIREACRAWGFFYVVDHGIDPYFISKVKDLSLEFFRKSKEFKKTVARTQANYRGFEDAEYTDLKLDWKETFDFTPEATNETDPSKRNQWPDGMPEFKDVMNEFFQLQLGISAKIMEAVLCSLDVSPKEAGSYFDGTGDTSFNRLSYYPPCRDVETNLGANPHTDTTAITLVLQDDSLSSLQVLKDGKYYDVPPVPNSFVVNLGEVVQVWSNEVYMAPIHQVLANKTTERLSSVFSYNPSNESEVKPLRTCVSKARPTRFQPINFREFYSQLHNGNFSGTAEGKGIESFRVTPQ